VHLAVDTLGQLLAAIVTPANEQDRAQGGALAEQIQEATDGTVEVAFVDQAHTGDQPTADAQVHGIRLEVVKPHPDQRPHRPGFGQPDTLLSPGLCQGRSKSACSPLLTHTAPVPAAMPFSPEQGITGMVLLTWSVGGSMRQPFHQAPIAPLPKRNLTGSCRNFRDDLVGRELDNGIGGNNDIHLIEALRQLPIDGLFNNCCTASTVIAGCSPCML
jgi:hypothetical protein